MDIIEINSKEIEEVLELQQNIYERLENKELLETIKREDMLQILDSNYSVGVYVDGQLKAMRGFYIPSYDEDDHLADDAGVEKESTIYSEITIIDESLRGQNLQLKMGEFLLSKLKEDNRFKYLIGTVMPTNVPSLKNTLRLGLNIVDTKIKYGDKRRHVLMLNLEEEIELKGEPIKIKYDDFDWMMTHGKDYIGTKLEDGYITYYKK